jgi:ribose transport system ATP-binding protein
MSSDVLLRMENITKTFPGVLALDKVSFSLKAGEVVSLVGENGAGKSTLMKILSGAYKKDSGNIFLNGKAITIENPAHAQFLGISIIYQEFNLTRNQSVGANIFIAREPRMAGLGKWLGLVDEKRMFKEAGDLLDKINCHISPKSIVGTLSVAQQQMVEIAKALAFDSQIIIMDEPTAALGESETNILFDTVRSLKKQGIAIIFITHRIEEIFYVSERIAVLRDGRFIGEMQTRDATKDRVVQMMVGRNVSEFIQKVQARITTPILEVKNLSRRGVVDNISFDLRRGEILGFAGLVGAGRTETARILFGADPKDSGEILINGNRRSIKNPLDAVKAGLSLVPEDRSSQGLVLKLSVLENIAMATLKNYSKAGWIAKRYMEETADNFVKKLAIRTPGLQQKAMFLSGGNQQKVVLSKWLASSPGVLILDEPTRGIDVGAKAEVYRLMSELVKTGMGIIMISSELPEILGMSDRIVVMHEGRIAAIMSRSEATQELIMKYASGQMQERVQFH